MGRDDFSDQFKKLIIHYEITGYNTNVMRQTAWMVVNLITVNNVHALFTYTQTGWASDIMMAPAKKKLSIKITVSSACFTMNLTVFMRCF